MTGTVSYIINMDEIWPKGCGIDYVEFDFTPKHFPPLPSPDAGGMPDRAHEKAFIRAVAPINFQACLYSGKEIEIFGQIESWQLQAYQVLYWNMRVNYIRELDSAFVLRGAL